MGLLLSTIYYIGCGFLGGCIYATVSHFLSKYRMKRFYKKLESTQVAGKVRPISSARRAPRRRIISLCMLCSRPMKLEANGIESCDCPQRGYK